MSSSLTEDPMVRGNMVYVALGTATHNLQNWGIQHPETVIAAATEELGEVSQAYLEATYQDGDPHRVHREIVQLMALLLQLNESICGHPQAFQPLPSKPFNDPGGDDGDE